MQTRLVDQDVGHLRTVVGHVLHAANALDVIWILWIGHPKSSLIDPIRFPFDLVGKTKSLEHFHGARVDAIGLALDDVGRHALHNHGLNVGELGQLGGQTQACRASARNQNIDFFGQGLIDTPISAVGGCLLDIGAAASETIFVKLHHCSPQLPILKAVRGHSRNNNCTY